MGLTKRRILGFLEALSIWKRGQTKGAKSGEMQRLNAEYLNGAIFGTPRGGAVDGGGVTSSTVRGTKTGNKVLSLWKGGKRNGKRRKSNEREEGSGDEGYC